MAIPEEGAKTVVKEVFKDKEAVRDLLWAISKVERTIGRPLTAVDMTALFSEITAPPTESIRLVLASAEAM